MAKKSLGIGIAVVIIIFAVIAFFVFANASKIADIKNEAHVGKSVTVRGIVESTIKLGSLSGYTLKDDTDTIAVSSEQLPKEGDTITVTGTLMHDTLFGYYIKVS
jgi:cytochrome c-type biogenesis protein CcmE